jgi:hypothetical protein
MVRKVLLYSIAALLIVMTGSYISIKHSLSATSEKMMVSQGQLTASNKEVKEVPAIKSPTPEPASGSSGEKANGITSTSASVPTTFPSAVRDESAGSKTEEELLSDFKFEDIPAMDEVENTASLPTASRAENQTASEEPYAVNSDETGNYTPKQNAVIPDVQSASVSRGVAHRSKEVVMLPWFDRVEEIFGIGIIAKVTDVATGTSFKVERTYGHNHADVETLTKEDTQVLLDIIGGKWNWDRRAVIVEVNGYRLAASMAPMPHAGLDEAPEDIWVEDRSDGYKAGYNLDRIKENDMEGHFDIHFYQSRTHGTDTVNQQHQDMVLEAYLSDQ